MTTELKHIVALVSAIIIPLTSIITVLITKLAEHFFGSNKQNQERIENLYDQMVNRNKEFEDSLISIISSQVEVTTKFSVIIEDMRKDQKEGMLQIKNAIKCHENECNENHRRLKKIVDKNNVALQLIRNRREDMYEYDEDE